MIYEFDFLSPYVLLLSLTCELISAGCIACLNKFRTRFYRLTGNLEFPSRKIILIKLFAKNNDKERFDYGLTKDFPQLN